MAEPTIDMRQEVPATPGRDPRGDRAALHWFIYVCMSCAGIVAAAIDASTATSDRSYWRVTWLIPESVALDVSLPSKVQHFLVQAKETLHSPSASIMMSSSAVNAMLKETGYKAGSLYARIEKAAKDGKFTADMALWAHEVRLDANDERHADELAAMPTMGDAQRALEFASTLAEILFVLPARVKKGLKKQTP